MTVEIAAWVFVIVVATLWAKHAIVKARGIFAARREERTFAAASKSDRAAAASQALRDMADAAQKELNRLGYRK